MIILSIRVETMY